MKQPFALLGIILLSLTVFTYIRVSINGKQSLIKEPNLYVVYPEQAVTGQKEYVQFCLACHQEDGNGVRGQFPPLAGNKTIISGADSIIRIVLFGLEGPITVNGRQYNMLMPAQNYLTDQQISDVLTYIRNSWGNKAPAVKPEQVKKIRAAGK